MIHSAFIAKAAEPLNDEHAAMLPALVGRFVEEFGGTAEDIRVFRAPGRVNLLGDHTDYTGGLVLPAAIDAGTLMLVRTTATGNTNTRRIRLSATDFPATAEVDATRTVERQGDSWCNYVLGVCDQFQRRDYALPGFDALYWGNLPHGSGLSSSASLEVVTAVALDTMVESKLSGPDIALLAQAAENEFVGMQCGIMDQFAVTMGERGHLLMLDCSTLDYQHVPLANTHYRIVVSNTHQRRELNHSAYNDRVAECERALAIASEHLAVTSLADIAPQQLPALEQHFDTDPLAWHRLQHIVGENQRVREAAAALQAADLSRFGALMNASHDSLRDLYAVSSRPLDTLVNCARQCPFVLGSRLTGAGFGGCTVSLVEEDKLDQFVEKVAAPYEQATGLQAEFHVIEAASGACAARIDSSELAP